MFLHPYFAYDQALPYTQRGEVRTPQVLYAESLGSPLTWSEERSQALKYLSIAFSCYK